LPPEEIEQIQLCIGSRTSSLPEKSIGSIELAFLSEHCSMRHCISSKIDLAHVIALLKKKKKKNWGNWRVHASEANRRGGVRVARGARPWWP
jgi:hypothetical protein